MTKLDHVTNYSSTAPSAPPFGTRDCTVGAHLSSDGGSSAGKAYLMLGPLSAGDHDIADAALTLTGTDAADYTGYRVSLGGDVDDDGNADGAPSVRAAGGDGISGPGHDAAADARTTWHVDAPAGLSAMTSGLWSMIA